MCFFRNVCAERTSRLNFGRVWPVFFVRIFDQVKNEDGLKGKCFKTCGTYNDVLSLLKHLLLNVS